jgi:hypothetical protein
MSFLRPPFNRPAPAKRSRPRRDTDPLHVEVIYVMLAAVAIWLGVLALQAGFAGAAKSRLAAPRPLGPADAATVQSLPAFSWRPVRGAAKYEFQLSADPAFESIVGGQGHGAFFTRNTSASVDEAVADGNYYWRVRAIDARDHAGRWSVDRSITKRWTDTPVLLGPPSGATVSYPRTPLVLRWEPIQGAFKYRVTLATDSQLANSALGPRKPWVETSGTALAIPWTLTRGTYYWAVTPLDAERHPGSRSAMASFTWRWPTTLATQPTWTDLVDGSDDPNDELFDPQLKWAPIAGAVNYQVEISTAREFPAGSIVCCTDKVTGTSLSPGKVLANNTGSGIAGDPEQYGYWWRVRAIDAAGNAGEWNYGRPFDNTYTPQIHLQLQDNLGATPVDRDPTTPDLVDTWAPAIVWNQVPGASSYEVRVVPYVQVPGTSTSVCNWSSTASDAWSVVTAATAWTPLGAPGPHKPTGVLTDLSPSNDGLHQPEDGTPYCVRVRARRDRDAKNREVVSDWATMGGGTAPAFRYLAPPEPTGATLAMSAGDYVQPVMAATHSWMPLLSWKPVDGARGYFVVVARDQQFTKVVDVAFTNVPVYAMRRNVKPWTYPDETTSYWWAVIPTALANGDIAPTPPTDNSPRRFIKSSTPPAPTFPASGQVVGGPTTFAWKPALGARSYTVQVAQDQSFAKPLINVTTDSTAYTSADTLPASSALYWRVRGNDELGTGLNWSAPRRFSRVLPVPVLSPANPVAGEGIPVLSWAHVQGAVSYDMHVEQVDGKKRDFNMSATAFTPIAFYGNGVWRWQVRANFPVGSRVVSGGYSASKPFTRHIATPANLRTVKTNRGVLLSWDPARMARRYRVQVSTTDSFSQIVEQRITDNHSWAPRMLRREYIGGKDLYWRVAVLDEGNNLGGWATRPLRQAPRAHMRVAGRLKVNRAGVVRVTVTGRKGRRLKGAIVRVHGAGIVVRPRVTNRRGTVRLRLTPKGRGRARFSADKAGYSPARAQLRVK